MSVMAATWEVRKNCLMFEKHEKFWRVLATTQFKNQGVETQEVLMLLPPTQWLPFWSNMFSDGWRREKERSCQSFCFSDGVCWFFCLLLFRCFSVLLASLWHLAHRSAAQWSQKALVWPPFVGRFDICESVRHWNSCPEKLWMFYPWKCSWSS